MMENKDGAAATAGARQACASCKHQRKRCREDCVLHPFFPASKNAEFQAVHKVFGVSNISKLLKSLHSDEDRQKAIESIVWEAECRQRNPVSGSYGEFLKIKHELTLLKDKDQVQSHGVTNQICPKGRTNNKTFMIGGNNRNNGIIGANGNGNNGIVGAGGVGFESTNTINNYIHSNNVGFIENQVQYSYGSLVQQAAEQEKRYHGRYHGRDGVAISIPNLLNHHEQYFYHPDQRSAGSEKLEEPYWQNDG